MRNQKEVKRLSKAQKNQRGRLTIIKYNNQLSYGRETAQRLLRFRLTFIATLFAKKQYCILSHHMGASVAI